MSPVLTVLLPVRDNRDTLMTALASLALQTMDDFVVLIIDDGSADGSADVAETVAKRDARFRLLRDGERRGLPARLNQGIALARTPVIARMDGDDIAYPSRFEIQLEILDKGADLVAAGTMVFRSGGVSVGARTCPEAHAQLGARPEAGFPMAHPTWLGRREWFRRWLYDERSSRFEDAELLMRSYAQSRFAGTPQLLLGYRDENLNRRAQLHARISHLRALRRLGGRPIPAARAARGAARLAGVIAMEQGLLLLGKENWLLSRRVDRPATPGELAEWASVYGRVLQVADDLSA